MSHHDDPMNLFSVLARRVAAEPGRLAYAFETEDGGEESLSYEQLARRAAAIAARLRETARPGDTALLLLPQGLDYVAAFWGCVQADVIAVPLFPPRRNRGGDRVEAVVTDSGARLALTDASTLSGLDRSLDGSPHLRALRWLDVQAIDREASSAPAVDAGAGVDPDALAFLQYTSGSTGTPRGVMVSHRNLLTNLRDIDAAIGHTPASVGLSWLPFFHDMGLIYGVLMPVFRGFPGHFLSPAAVMQRPRRWLETISRLRATHSGGPNFIYDLCVRAIRPEQRAGLDLGSWTMAHNGAEPVRHATLERFAAAFGPQGFDPAAFCPCYGLAEATLKVAAVPRWTAPRTFFVRDSGLRRHRVELTAGGTDVSVPLVGCGSTAIDTRIAVVDPETRRPCEPGQIGEIWVAGDTVARGYWRRPEETAAAFIDGWFHTGDLGYLDADGYLFIVGRKKDMIISGGLNVYPAEVEKVVASHPAVAECAVVGTADPKFGEVGLAHVVARDGADLEPGSLRDFAAERLATYKVPRHWSLHPEPLPRTASGKVQKHLLATAVGDDA
jgi:acyl-CoA synthetase (AMP-forming)/AMP-acid ligase II